MTISLVKPMDNASLTDDSLHRTWLNETGERFSKLLETGEYDGGSPDWVPLRLVALSTGYMREISFPGCPERKVEFRIELLEPNEQARARSSCGEAIEWLTPDQIAAATGEDPRTVEDDYEQLSANLWLNEKNICIIGGQLRISLSSLSPEAQARYYKEKAESSGTGGLRQDQQPESRDGLLRYHPNWYSASRDFFPTLYTSFKHFGPRDGLLSLSEYQQLCSSYIDGYWNPHLLETPVAQRPHNTKRMSDEFDTFCHAARFFFTGRNIFHFSNPLTQLLKFTEVDDVRWDAIRLPFTCFYIWFGPQDEWPLKDGRHFVDGAYIGEAAGPHSRGLDIFLTTRSSDPGDPNSWNYVLQDDAYYYFTFDIEGSGDTVGDSLRATLEKSADFNKEWRRADIPEEARRMAENSGKRLRQLPREQTAQGEKVCERLQDLPVFREVLRLVVNCLCYLSSPSRDVTVRYPESAITRAIVEGKTPLERARARNQVSRQGFTLINFCGDSLGMDSPYKDLGRELSAHWRRGHWRNQAVGVARSGHKLIWIRPTLVRKDKADAGVPGHVYDVTD